MYEVWYQEIEQIAHKVDVWCNFSLVCGCIGLALSVACAVYLIWRWKHGKVT